MVEYDLRLAKIVIYKPTKKTFQRFMWEKIIHAKIEFYWDIHKEEKDLQHAMFVISKISKELKGAHKEES